MVPTLGIGVFKSVEKLLDIYFCTEMFEMGAM